MADPSDLQREMIALIEEANGEKVDVTSVKTDHCPNLTVEKKTIDLVLNVVKEAQES